MRSRTRRSRGFTLIEMMVVVIIIGLILAIVAPGIIGQGEAAKMKLTKAQIKQIEAALRLFKLETGTYPQSLQELITQPSGFNGMWPRGGFMETMPKDAWNREFTYSAQGPGDKAYLVKSLGADGQEGGTDENADITN